MAREAVFPAKQVSDSPGSKESEVFTHDAFGTIAMTIPSGGDGTLFGSDLRHNQCVRITIQRAKKHRDLSRDWIHSDVRPIVEIEMSHAQFAQFITSQGRGEGTPCTLRYAPERGTPVSAMPGIKNIESKAETHRREIRESAQRQLANLKEQIDRFGAMLESGKVGVKEAREIHRNLAIQMGNLPSNMEFVVHQSERALENAEYASKVEIEAYLDQAVRRIGLDNISQLGLMIEHNKEST